MKNCTFFLFSLLMLLLFSCRDRESLPVVPEISFKSYSKVTNAVGKDSLIRISFNYLDGDGDLGLSARDTFPPFHYTAFNKFYYNIFIDYLEKKGGVFVPVTVPFTNDTIRFLYRMDVITPTGKNKAIKGDITMDIDLSPYPVKPDTIQFKVQIADRQLHLSNTTESPQINMNY
jgi:hypothetical protein